MDHSIENRLPAKHVLLCEGSDECEIFEGLLRRLGKNDTDLSVFNAHGRPNLQRALEDRVRSSGWSRVRHVGVVLDCEESPDATKALIDRLEKVLEETPHRASLTALVLPSPQQTGSLETFIRKGMGQGSNAALCADQWEACANQNPAGAQLTQAWRDKRWLHVWLLSHARQPYSRIGFYLRQEAEGVPAEIQAPLDELKDWLERFLTGKL